MWSRWRWGPEVPPPAPERWDVIRDGRHVATLTDPQYEDMFWYWWVVTSVSGDSHEAAAVLTPAFWSDEYLERTTFRDPAGQEASAFWAPNGFRGGRLLMRGLGW